MNHRIVDVEGKGISWTHMKRLGFKYQTRFKVSDTIGDWPYPTVPTTYPAITVHANGIVTVASNKPVKVTKREQRKHLGLLFQTLLVDKTMWRFKAFKSNENAVQVFTKDLDWMVLARLHGFDHMLKCIERIEKIIE